MLVLAGIAMLAAAAAPADPPPAGFVGQWVWSRQDAALFHGALQRRPGLLAGVWASTIAYEGGRVVQRLALSPAVQASREAALVVRFDDAFSAVWSGQDDARIAAEVAERLRALLAHADATGIRVTEVQLDHDCPVRHLARWAGLIDSLGDGGRLDGRPLWVTSLVAHVQTQGYGELFRPHVAGHILQVFDTGDRFGPQAAERLSDLAAAGRMPFRLGLGAFERVLPGGETTGHRLWFGAVPVFERNPWFRGLWVFPGGRRWLPLLETLP